jgi:hypothetical protein
VSITRVVCAAVVELQAQAGEGRGVMVEQGQRRGQLAQLGQALQVQGARSARGFSLQAALRLALEVWEVGHLRSVG